MVAVSGFTTIWGVLAVAVSGRGYPVDGSFLMCRSTQPTDYRWKVRCDSPGKFHMAVDFSAIVAYYVWSEL